MPHACPFYQTFPTLHEALILSDTSIEPIQAWSCPFLRRHTLSSSQVQLQVLGSPASTLWDITSTSEDVGPAGFTEEKEHTGTHVITSGQGQGSSCCR